MNPAALALVFALASAPSADAPRLESVDGGFLINESGMQKLNGQLADFQRQIVALQTADAKLQEDVALASAKPALTWKSAALLLGAGFLLGVGTTAAVVVWKR